MSWHWCLTTAEGLPLAEHTAVVAAASWQYAAFIDLHGYLSRTTTPDNRVVRQAQILDELGRWIADELYGPHILAHLLRHRAVVRLVIPYEARVLAYHPVDAAVHDGCPLLLRGVTTVLDIRPLCPRPDSSPSGLEPRRPGGSRLRVLALFSLPEGSTALNLRQERRSLEGLVERVTRERGVAIELRVLQYGVTRDRLRQVVTDPEGWDILHLSGHGDRGTFLLEGPGTTPDPVLTDELVPLLAPLAPGLRLVTLSSCSSADVSLEEQRTLLGLPSRSRHVARAAPAGNTPAPTTALAQTLGCVVVGMRYPVTQAYASLFTSAFYQELLAARGTVTDAFTAAALRAYPSRPSSSSPPISTLTPVLIGAAAGRTWCAPPAASYAPSDQSVIRANAPTAAPVFVGRVSLMARANEALASSNGCPGVLLHGMAGSGKTAVAQEIVFLHHEDYEAVVWYKAPDEGSDPATALVDFAGALEAALPSVRLLDAAEDESALRARLPALTEHLRARRVLLVLDNLESLLRPDGTWHTTAWRLLIDVLTGHEGASRTVLTSRYRPLALNERVRVMAVHALPRREAVLMARELPHLRRLIDDDAPKYGPGLFRNMLAATRGHPALIELAEGQAANPDQLRSFLLEAAELWQEYGVHEDTPPSPVIGYAEILARWTERALTGLSPAARLLAQAAVCLEEGDRVSLYFRANWQKLWTALTEAGPEPARGLAPAWSDAVAELVGRALVVAVPDNGETRLILHPSVAAAIRGTVPPRRRAMVDRTLAEFWLGGVKAGFDGAHSGNPAQGRLLILASLSAVPYMTRSDFGLDTLLFVLEHALTTDDSPATRSTLLPYLRTVLERSHGTTHEARAERLYAEQLLRSDPPEGERRLRALLARGDEKARWPLRNHYLSQGRLDEALHLSDRTSPHALTDTALTWESLGNQVHRLQVLEMMGWSEQVLAAVPSLQTAIETLAASQQGGAAKWHVPEVLLQTGQMAALDLGHWAQALAFNTQLIKAMGRRGAPPLDIASARMNAYPALLGLGRLDEAERRLQACRAVFEGHRAWRALGKVFGALGSLEDQRGRNDQALVFRQEAIRYAYRTTEAASIAGGHTNLGASLRLTGAATEALAHQLAAALLNSLTVKNGDRYLHNAALALRALDGHDRVPRTVKELTAVTNRVTGVHLDRLLTLLDPGATQSQTVLDTIVEAVWLRSSELDRVLGEHSTSSEENR
ncbi:hypothetical protein GCM10022227_13770 [Streptomyces sedi]